MRTRRIFVTIALIAAATLAVSLLPSCKGRKIRAELVAFVKVLEETKAPGDRIVNQFVQLQNQTDIKGTELEKILEDLVRKIDALLAPVKNIKLETKEIREMRELYVNAWESLKDSLSLISLAMKSQDQNLKATLMEQLQAKMAVYEQSTQQFEKKYVEMTKKYGVTRQDIGEPPSTQPLTPSPEYPSPQPFTPFEPSPQPAPFSP